MLPSIQPGTSDSQIADRRDDVRRIVVPICAGLEQQVLACGPAGSAIVYNGSVWHGHSANQTAEPRRSIQGAYVRRTAEPRFNQVARIRQETLRRISPLAKYVLAV